MVGRLGQQLEQRHPTTAVLRGSRQHLLKRWASDVVRAGCSEQRSPRLQDSESPQVDLVVSPECLGDRTLGLGEGGWIEDDEIEAAALSLPAPQEVEGVSLEKFDV